MSHHEVGVDPTHHSLVRLVEPNVHGLDKTRAVSGDELKLNTQALDCITNRAKKMHLEGIQKRMGMIPMGQVAMYGARTCSTHSSMTASSNPYFFLHSVIHPFGMGGKLSACNPTLSFTLEDNHRLKDLVRGSHRIGSTSFAVVCTHLHVDGAYTLLMDGVLGGLLVVSVCLVHVKDEILIADTTNTFGNCYHHIRLDIAHNSLGRALRRVHHNPMNQVVLIQETRNNLKLCLDGLVRKHWLQLTSFLANHQTSDRPSPIPPDSNEGNEIKFDVIKVVHSASMILHSFTRISLRSNQKVLLPPVQRCLTHANGFVCACQTCTFTDGLINKA